jgi:hypothetical protein
LAAYCFPRKVDGPLSQDDVRGVTTLAAAKAEGMAADSLSPGQEMNGDEWRKRPRL